MSPVTFASSSLALGRHVTGREREASPPPGDLSWRPRLAPIQGKVWCQKPQVAMTLTTKDGRTWYSHTAAKGWCKGKERILGRPVLASRKDPSMARRCRFRLSGVVLLVGLQLGCQPHPRPVPPPPPPPVQEAPGVTTQERQAALIQRNCAALGAVAHRVASDRTALQVTEDEALAHVAQLVREHLQTTATPASVMLTGLRISAVVHLVYIFSTWTPDEAAFYIRTICLGTPSTPSTPREGGRPALALLRHT